MSFCSNKFFFRGKMRTTRAKVFLHMLRDTHESDHNIRAWIIEDPDILNIQFPDEHGFSCTILSEAILHNRPLALWIVMHFIHKLNVNIPEDGPPFLLAMYQQQHTVAMSIIKSVHFDMVGLISLDRVASESVYYIEFAIVHYNIKDVVALKSGLKTLLDKKVFKGNMLKLISNYYKNPHECREQLKNKFV